MNNVIFLRKGKSPSDLLSFKEFSEKWGIKEGSVRKAQARGHYQRYKRGIWKISDSEAIQYWNEVS